MVTYDLEVDLLGVGCVFISIQFILIITFVVSKTDSCRHSDTTQLAAYLIQVPTSGVKIDVTDQG